MKILGRCGGLLDTDKAHTFSADGTYFLIDAVNVDIDRLGFIKKRPAFELVDKNTEMYNGIHSWWRKSSGFVDAGGYVGSDNVAYIRAAKNQPISAILGNTVINMENSTERIIASDGTYYSGRALVVPMARMNKPTVGTITVSAINSLSYTYTVIKTTQVLARTVVDNYIHTITFTGCDIDITLSSTPGSADVDLTLPQDWIVKYIGLTGVTTTSANITINKTFYVYKFSDYTGTKISDAKIREIIIKKLAQAKWSSLSSDLYDATVSFDNLSNELVYNVPSGYPATGYVTVVEDLNIGYFTGTAIDTNTIRVSVVEGEGFWQDKLGATKIRIYGSAESTGRMTIYGSRIGDMSDWELEASPTSTSPFEYLLPRYNNTPILFVAAYRSILVGDDTALWIVGTTTDPVTALTPPVQNRVSSVGAVFAKGAFYKYWYIYVDNNNQVRSVVYDQQTESFKSTLLSWQIEKKLKQDRPVKLVAWNDKILAITETGALYVCNMSDDGWAWVEWEFSAPVYDADVILGNLYIMLFKRSTDATGETIYTQVPGEVLVNTLQTPYGNTDEQYFIDEIVGEDGNKSSITFTDYDKWAVALDDKYAIISDDYVDSMSFDYAQKIVYGRKNRFSLTLAPVFLYPLSRERVSKLRLNVYNTTKFITYMAQSLKGGEWKPVGDVPVGDVVASGSDIASIPILGYSAYPYIKIEQTTPGLFTLTSIAAEG